ncbi:MAG TPA: hypothetical protein PLL33_06805, partial [Paracoccus sp. (in: a-proteobacteria)]|nr:hypothetical protein [Paracoccus sp. (in: a-proteobacteria)]
PPIRNRTRRLWCRKNLCNPVRQTSRKPDRSPALPADVPPQVAAIIAALADLDEDFEPADDLHLVTQRFRGRRWETIAGELGCGENDVKARWRLILRCKVAQTGGIVTPQGWSDLMAAARLRAGQD